MATIAEGIVLLNYMSSAFATVTLTVIFQSLNSVGGETGITVKKQTLTPIIHLFRTITRYFCAQGKYIKLYPTYCIAVVLVRR